jgi:hypothetical protein
MTVPARTSEASEREHKHGLIRRTFLAGLGASGLATAATLFGRATPASAVTAGCCNLCYNPGNFNSCDSGTHYLWECAYGGSQYLFCYCCEHGTTDKTCAGVTFSAYSCHYG